MTPRFIYATEALNSTILLMRKITNSSLGPRIVNCCNVCYSVQSNVSSFIFWRRSSPFTENPCSTEALPRDNQYHSDSFP